MLHIGDREIKDEYNKNDPPGTSSLTRSLEVGTSVSQHTGRAAVQENHRPEGQQLP